MTDNKTVERMLTKCDESQFVTNGEADESGITIVDGFWSTEAGSALSTAKKAIENADGGDMYGILTTILSDDSTTHAEKELALAYVLGRSDGEYLAELFRTAHAIFGKQ